VNAASIFKVVIKEKEIFTNRINLAKHALSLEKSSHALASDKAVLGK
jgi:hypothetical protein